MSKFINNSHWTETTLGEIAEYINGYPFKPEDLGEEGTPVIRIKQLLDPNEVCDKTLIEAPNRCVLQSGDIVFSWSGTLAVRVWDRERAYLNQHLFRVVEKEGVLHKWLPFVIEHSIRDLSEMTHGTTMKHVTKQTLLPHAVQLPPLSEQKRIVDVINSVDSYIAALQQQAADARTARNAVLHALLTAGGSDATETKLGDVASAQPGYAFNSELFSETLGTPLIRIRDLKKQTWTETKYTGEFDPQYRVTSGDFLIGMDGEFQCYEWMGQDALLNQRVCRLHKFDLKRVVPRMVYLMINSHLQSIERATSFTTVKHISSTQIENIVVKLPDLREQQRIVGLVTAIDDTFYSTEQLITNAQKLRTGLLSDLLSGDHGIPESYDRLLGAA